MRKPSFERFETFIDLFADQSRRAGKEQYIVPYLMSAFPGCTLGDMKQLAAWLENRGWSPQQVQCFIPLPGTVSAAMFAGDIGPDGEPIQVARTDAERLRQHGVLAPTGQKPGTTPRKPGRKPGHKTASGNSDGKPGRPGPKGSKPAPYGTRGSKRRPTDRPGAKARPHPQRQTRTCRKAEEVLMIYSYRTLYPALIPTLTCCLFLLFAAAPAHTAETRPPGMGSDLVLHTVWNDVELISQPTEKLITYQDAPDLTSPAYTEPTSSLAPLAPALRGSIRSVDVAAGSPVAKPVALTFDLCERSDETTGYDGAIVDWLRQHHVSATFFAGGKWMRSHPERTMQLMADPLFELGNHGWTHGNLRVMTGKKMRSQVLWTQVQYEVLRAELAKRYAAQAGNTEKARAAMAAIPLALRTLRFPLWRVFGRDPRLSRPIRSARHPMGRGHGRPGQEPDRERHRQDRARPGQAGIDHHLSRQRQGPRYPGESGHVHSDPAETRLYLRNREPSPDPGHAARRVHLLRGQAGRQPGLRQAFRRRYDPREITADSCCRNIDTHAHRQHIYLI